METKQINLKISGKLFDAAERYVEEYGFRNIQEFAAESMREKIFEKSKYDETITDKEIAIIDRIIETSIKKKKFVSEKELFKVLKK